MRRLGREVLRLQFKLQMHTLLIAVEISNADLDVMVRLHRAACAAVALEQPTEVMCDRTCPK